MKQTSLILLQRVNRDINLTDTNLNTRPYLRCLPAGRETHLSPSENGGQSQQQRARASDGGTYVRNIIINLWRERGRCTRRTKRFCHFAQQSRIRIGSHQRQNKGVRGWGEWGRGGACGHERLGNREVHKAETVHRNRVAGPCAVNRRLHNLLFRSDASITNFICLFRRNVVITRPADTETKTDRRRGKKSNDVGETTLRNSVSLRIGGIRDAAPRRRAVV